MPIIWSQTNPALLITSCVALGKRFTSLSLLFFISKMQGGVVIMHTLQVCWEDKKKKKAGVGKALHMACHITGAKPLLVVSALRPRRQVGSP